MIPFSILLTRSSFASSLLQCAIVWRRGTLGYTLNPQRLWNSNMIPQLVSDGTRQISSLLYLNTDFNRHIQASTQNMGSLLPECAKPSVIHHQGRPSKPYFCKLTQSWYGISQATGYFPYSNIWEEASCRTRICDGWSIAFKRSICLLSKSIC